MAEILLEPSSLSKIIPLSFDLNDTNASNAAQLMTKRQFNTADTDAWFQISLEGFVDTAGSFDITLFNLNDKSVFNHTGKPFTTNPFYYKLDSESDETTNEIRHAGRWIGQIVVTLANGNSATRKFIFDIEGHILDGADVQTILLEDYNALIATINTSKDLLAQYNVDYAALLVDLAAAETARTNTYNQLVADQQANIDAFDVALDTGIVAANLAEKLEDFEEINNSRLLSTERQLADTLNKSAITLTHMFADNAERDVYFVTHPTELIELQFVKVGTAYQQYIEGVWTDSMPIVSEALDQIDDLSASADRTWSSSKINGTKANKVQEAWITPTLLNGWAHHATYGGLKYYKDEFGIVTIKGAITNSTTPNGGKICMMPVGYRPEKYLIFITAQTAGSTSVVPCLVDQWGNFQYYGTPSNISINLQYKAEA